MSSILGVFDANRRSRSLKAVLNNLNLAVESMSKEMRFGQVYHCGPGTITMAQDCPNGDTLMSFLSSDGGLNGTTLEKSVAGAPYVEVTAPEISIDDLEFYTLGTSKNDGFQPKVLIKIRSHAGTGRGRTDFTLQTLVSQRVLDY
jgi:hypothetical protein